jgi:hypothetical protein
MSLREKMGTARGRHRLTGFVFLLCRSEKRLSNEEIEMTRWRTAEEEAKKSNETSPRMASVAESHNLKM